ncbi:lytic murein transglycosylase [Pseudoponticoccus marisrubri]|uniref:lytic murein transglycosylase n=1 Tax=Pseudoponticoccus marisrubri TaxID=1685382 RepID=UPI000ABFE1E6|nr:lytic murein transglycosylase [Pseudoponticoccus marisrubri]
MICKKRALAVSIGLLVTTTGVGAERPCLTNAPCPAFSDWLIDLGQQLRAEGLAQATIDRALAGLSLNEQVVELENRQPDFIRTLGDYLDRAVTSERIRLGRKKLSDYADLLQEIETRYGVPPQVIVAIWGVETSYGGYRGRSDIVRALASLAYAGRRSAFFQTELIAALRLLETEGFSRKALRGSWAGALGHTQFMPSSYLKFAVDFDTDGQRNLMADNPADALGSAGAYLAAHGWSAYQDWALEVRLPDGFDYRLAHPDIRKTPKAWAALGVVPMHGRPQSPSPASIYLPVGAEGPALLRFGNFEALKAYNVTPAYILSVGLLADALVGRPKLATPWPTQRLLSLPERQEMQTGLAQAGLFPGEVTGKMTPNFITAVQNYQEMRGMIPDGFPSESLLKDIQLHAN